jgi:PAS domain S-box-containing protein
MSSIQTLALIINIAVACAAGIGALRKSSAAGAEGLFVLAICAAISSECFLLYDSPTYRSLILLWAGLIFLSAGIAAAAILALTLARTGKSNWLNRRTLVLLAILPVLTQVLFWVPSLRTSTFQLAAMPAANSVFMAGTWARINAAYVYGLIAASLIVSIGALLRRARSWLDPLVFSTLCLSAPALILIVDFAGYEPFPNIDFLPFALTLSALGFLQAVLRRPEGDVGAVDREAVVEGMDEGWMVLDSHNIILDMNAASERMTGLTRSAARGQHVSTLMGDSPRLGQALDASQEFEMKRSLRSEEGWRYLSMRISPLTGPDQRPFGRLAVWRDMTERKRMEDARQRAREEMFALINAISNASSNTLSMDDFLLESIYHIVSPFRSPFIGIFLMDDGSQDGEEPRLHLASYLGLPAASAEDLKYLPASSPLFDWVIQNRLPFQVEDAETDGRVPAEIRRLPMACFLIIPLMVQEGEDNKFIGCICLSRKEKPIFSQDEIVRLSAIADHMANLIDSDRRRRHDITTKERQKLMRDLHDSVSQKLYGVVTMTEAAQASLEAGSAVDPAQEFARIGENARQAVREMRLFLYQMQQIDIEKEGLVSVLHHRISAVEGRSDIKARLLAADEGISLSKEKELTLYYIAQEALNNVLRHAHAKSVLVTLKQGRRNVIMEVSDDGCGFNTKKVDRSGLGLQNMRERVALLSGTLKIHSKPNQGTTIVVTVRKDPVRRASKAGKAQ